MNESIFELCQLYKSDKCPGAHIKTSYRGSSYAKLYDTLLGDKKNTATRVLEVGIGSMKKMSNFVDGYITGASLFIWRDYFTKATIFGFDHDPSCNIREERIEIVIGDATKIKDLQKIIDLYGGGFDVIIDDCSHHLNQQIITADFLIPHLKEDGIYFIENVRKSEELINHFKDSYGCEFIQGIKDADDDLLIIKK